jgi:hypothetical protein
MHTAAAVLRACCGPAAGQAPGCDAGGHWHPLVEHFANLERLRNPFKPNNLDDDHFVARCRPRRPPYVRQAESSALLGHFGLSDQLRRQQSRRTARLGDWEEAGSPAQETPSTPSLTLSLHPNCRRHRGAWRFRGCPGCPGRRPSCCWPPPLVCSDRPALRPPRARPTRAAAPSRRHVSACGTFHQPALASRRACLLRPAAPSSILPVTHPRNVQRPPRGNPAVLSHRRWCGRPPNRPSCRPA